MNNDDLHLCEKSNQSQTFRSLDLCQCPPEYYCVEYCGEGTLESISSLISWQHFPRSTSTRSRCDSSSEEPHFKKSVTSSTVSEREQRTEKAPSIVSSTEYPITKTISQLNALHYLEIRHVYDLLNFMIGHLVCNEPDDPVQFWEDLLEKCVKYRDSFGEPPLLFTRHHIKSLYKAFDPFERGYINVEQYQEAMTCLGLSDTPTPLNEKTQGEDDGFISEKDFVFEAERLLVSSLDKMFRIPKPWEENRLKWKKKMYNKSIRNLGDFENKENGGSLVELKKTHKKYCTCGGISKSLKKICDCAPKKSIVYEPKQLFLEDFIC